MQHELVMDDSAPYDSPPVGGHLRRILMMLSHPPELHSTHTPFHNSTFLSRMDLQFGKKGSLNRFHLVFEFLLTVRLTAAPPSGRG